jgi:hypothetical protein
MEVRRPQLELRPVATAAGVSVTSEARQGHAVAVYVTGHRGAVSVREEIQSRHGERLKKPKKEGKLVLYANTELASGPQAAADVEKDKFVRVGKLQWQISNKTNSNGVFPTLRNSNGLEPSWKPRTRAAKLRTPRPPSCADSRQFRLYA